MPRLNDRAILAISYLAFFISGGAALVYEISWSRQIGLLFGHTSQSATVVLVSYFTGTAFGCLAGARWARRVQPLLAYAVAELAAAGWACIVPALMRLSEAPTSGVWMNSSSPVLQTTMRAAFCFLLLMPATIALGATLPMMAEFLSSSRWRETDFPGVDRVSVAYALNTAGALFGVTVATFFLLPVVGVSASGYIAAGLSAACALLACAVSVVERQKGASANPSRDETSIMTFERFAERNRKRLVEATCEVSVRESRPNQRRWLVVVALSGFGAMSLEVLYIRLFSLVFHNSTYTFGAVIAVFVAALAAGAAIVARLQRVCRMGGLAAHIACLSALATLLSLLVFSQLTGLDYFSYGHSFSSYMCGVFLLVGVVVGPPVTSLGVLLPAAWQGSGQEMSAGRVVGRLTAVNAGCSAVGAATTTFFILPWLGLWLSFTLVAALFFAVSFVLLLQDGQRWLAAGGGVLFAVLAGFALSVPLESNNSRTEASERLVRRWQSTYGVVDVMQNRETGSFKVRQNLHYRFGETRTAVRESRQAHIPLLLHERPTDIFVMGLGTGLTAGGVIAHNDVESIVVVELIPEVIQAARLLADYNHGVVDHPKVEMRIDDARHSLLTCARRFDVIVSDMFVPWESETGYLYTVEHYQVARQRLKPGGLFCQWIPLYQLGEQEFELIADSFASVFPRTTVWWGNIDPSQPIIALIGSESVIEVDALRLSARLAHLHRVAVQRDEYLGTAQLFHTLYLGDWTAVKANFLNTDEQPRVEFLTPISHREQRLLHGSTLHEYFDEKLVRLQSRNAWLQYPGGQAPATAAKRHAGNRFVLFGQ
ncbi:MAG: fused MFS/spermidine synthase [Pirellulales bacterium]|nr:fused MFS/spermidine synthase [Pirellulales bacterium]